VAELQRSKRAMTEMSGALREAEERMGRANATKDGLLNHVRLLEGEVRRLQAAGGGGAGDSDVAAERERMHDALVREGAAKRELEDEVLRMEQELVRVRRDEERRARDAKRGMASARCETWHGEREMRNAAWRARHSSTIQLVFAIALVLAIVLVFVFAICETRHGEQDTADEGGAGGAGARGARARRRAI